MIAAVPLISFCNYLGSGISSAASLISHVKEPALCLFNLFKPYQPVIATGTILGKMAWGAKKARVITQEVKQLDKKISYNSSLRRIIQRNGFPAERLEKDILELKTERDKKNFESSMGILSFGQFPSLFFDHPGANPFQCLYHIGLRGISIAQNTTQICKPATEDVTKLAASSLAMLGTTASLLKHTGIVDEGDPIAHPLINLALGVSILEIAHTAIKYAEARFRG